MLCTSRNHAVYKQQSCCVQVQVVIMLCTSSNHVMYKKQAIMLCTSSNHAVSKQQSCCAQVVIMLCTGYAYLQPVQFCTSNHPTVLFWPPDSLEYRSELIRSNTYCIRKKIKKTFYVRKDYFLIKRTIIMEFSNLKIMLILSLLNLSPILQQSTSGLKQIYVYNGLETACIARV